MLDNIFKSNIIKILQLYTYYFQFLLSCKGVSARETSCPLWWQEFYFFDIKGGFFYAQ